MAQKEFAENKAIEKMRRMDKMRRAGAKKPSMFTKVVQMARTLNEEVGKIVLIYLIKKKT